MSKAARSAGTSGTCVYTRTTPQYTSGIMSCRMKIDITNPNGSVGPILVYTPDAGDGGKFFVRFGPSGYIQAWDYDVIDYVNVVAYTANTWYKVDFEWDASGQANRYRVRINNGSWTGWMLCNGSTYSYIDQFKIRDLATNTHTFELDNISGSGSWTPTETFESYSASSDLSGGSGGQNWSANWSKDSSGTITVESTTAAQEEAIVPDSLLTQTNLVGSLTDIDEDPDSPDANWLTASSNNADSICIVSFGTPTGNPTTGAAIQNFKWWARLTANGTACTYDVYLRENGTRINGGTAIATGSLTSTSGQLITATWNASLLGTADGSLVEAELVVTKSGGAPASRTTGEVGAVEWNCVYEPVGSQTYNESISMSATSALSDSNTASLQEAITASASSSIGLGGSFLNLTEAIVASSASAIAASGGLVLSENVSLSAVGAVTGAAWKEINELVALATAAGLSSTTIAQFVAEASLAGVSGLSAVSTLILTEAIVQTAASGIVSSGGLVLNEAVAAAASSGITASFLHEMFAGITNSAVASISLSEQITFNALITMAGTTAIAATYIYEPAGGGGFVTYIFQINVLEE